MVICFKGPLTRPSLKVRNRNPEEVSKVNEGFRGDDSMIVFSGRNRFGRDIHHLGEASERQVCLATREDFAYAQLIIWCTWYTDFGRKLDMFWSYAD